jgi:hypothetical protein
MVQGREGELPSEIDELVYQLERERKRADELTAELEGLRRPSRGQSSTPPIS